jgi:surface antigen
MNSIRMAVCVLGSGAALAAAPAFAQDNHWQRAEGYGNWNHRPAVVDHRRFAPVARPYVIERGAAVYHAQPAYYGQPVYSAQPAYYGQPAYGAVQAVNPGTVIGAAAGALIGSQLGDRHNRTAAAAIGALLGGLLGSQM